MTPPIFENASLWFKLFKLATPPEHVWGRAPFADGMYEHRAVLKAMVDGKKRTIQFTVLSDDDYNLVLDVEVNVAKDKIISFVIFYERSLDDLGERCDSEHWGSRHRTFVSEKYLKYSLPVFDTVEKADAVEHVIMMFILSVDGVMA